MQITCACCMYASLRPCVCMRVCVYASHCRAELVGVLRVHTEGSRSSIALATFACRAIASLCRDEAVRDQLGISGACSGMA